MDMAMGADLVPVRMSPAELTTARQALRAKVQQLLQCVLYYIYIPSYIYIYIYIRMYGHGHGG